MLQHDNAPAHVPGGDPDIVSAGNCGRTNIDLVPQPPNSPDLNILDLGLFNGLQSLQYKTSPSIKYFTPRVWNMKITIRKLKTHDYS